jgi:Transcriptional regulators
MTKKDAVVEALREQVISGVLAPGTRLQQQEIAAQLNVSPTPVREAFLALASEGLLEIRAHYGAVVATPKYEDLRDTYRIRGLLEGEALRLAVKHVDSKLISELQEHVDEGALALRTLDSSSYRRASAKFHEALVAASHSNVFVSLGRQLIARTTFPLERRLMVERQKDHRALVDALRERKWERAIAILKRHTERTPLVVEEIIRRSAAAADMANGKRTTAARRAKRTKRAARAKRPRG